jgi:hypothetical protein
VLVHVLNFPSYSYFWFHWNFDILLFSFAMLAGWIGFTPVEIPSWHLFCSNAWILLHYICHRAWWLSLRLFRQFFLGLPYTEVYVCLVSCFQVGISFEGFYYY